MTQKELLYMEDAISHQQNLVTICEDFSSRVEDEDLSSFLTKLAKKHQGIEEKLMNVLEDARNEW